MSDEIRIPFTHEPAGDAEPERPRGVIPPERWPVWIQGHPEVKGLFVGGCVDRGVGSSFRAQAHAHTHEPNKGWICVRGWRRLAQKSLMLHELAHILTEQGHTDKWRKCLRALGGKVARHNQKRKRKLCKCGAHRFVNPGSAIFFNEGPRQRLHSWAECRELPEQSTITGKDATP